MARHLRIEQGRDHQGDGAEWLHHDERSNGESAELAEDGDAQQERADDPRRTTQQAQEMRDPEPLFAGLAGDPLDLPAAGSLLLRAELHENGSGQRKRNAEKQPGVVQEPDELLAGIVDLHAPHHGNRA